MSVDDLSTARYVVGTAFARAAKEHYSAADIDAFAEFVRSPHYGDVLLGNRAYGAWVGSEMVGVAAWSLGEAKSPTARILAVFVHPLFSGDGIGTRLTEYLEDEARAAGYRALETSATLNAASFFERLDYLEVRRGAWGLPSGRRCRSPSCARSAAPAPTSCTDDQLRRVRPSSRRSDLLASDQRQQQLQLGAVLAPGERQPQWMEQRAALAATRRLERRDPHVPGRVVPRDVGKQRGSLVGQLAVLDERAASAR